jgi:hypothetical protein
MTDDDRRDDDRRDDALASHLEVDPLDDLTRRRLVSRAMAASATEGATTPANGRDRSTLTRLVAAAAVFLVLAVGMVALLTTNDGGNDVTVADRKADQAARATPQAGSGSASDQDTSAAAEVAPSADATTAADASGDSGTAALATNLGDVGDLSTSAARRRLLDTIDAWLPQVPIGRVAGLGVDACRLAEVPRFIGSGSGTVDGRDAFVVVNERADGSNRVRLVISDPCEVRQLR